MDNSAKEREALSLVAEAEKKVRSGRSFIGAFFGLYSELNKERLGLETSITYLYLQWTLRDQLSSSSILVVFFLRRGSSKLEEACELYVRAANMFKMAKNWSAAGNSFCESAKLHLRLQSKHDAATNFVDAGNAFKKTDPQEAINCLNRAIEIYTDMGRFTIAAKHHISIAEIYESELVDIDKAIAHYEQAADYYKGEESNSSANKCLLKIATYAAQLEQYPKAIEIYEQLALSKYEEMFPAFSDSRECKLVKKLLEAFEDQNIDSYTNAVKEYDSISRLDQWLTTMLLRIKKTIQAEESDLR
ncbi:alpha-soluble NSF attachment protein isoform X2 [Narcine bancroftii]|uniref:alpha-soluble NSF attachment protein isoform X2 n=1 Tax=Narcine bancroftii TaxID=1343680 RepID=UPI00383123AA